MRDDPLRLTNLWLDPSTIRPSNTPPPAGATVVDGVAGVEMVASPESQSVLSRYGYDAWLWVRLEAGLIPKGRASGQPTYHVWLDNVDVGWFGASRVAGFVGRIPDGAWLTAHIPDRTADRMRDRYALRVRMPARQ